MSLLTTLCTDLFPQSISNYLYLRLRPKTQFPFSEGMCEKLKYELPICLARLNLLRKKIGNTKYYCVAEMLENCVSSEWFSAGEIWHCLEVVVVDGWDVAGIQWVEARDAAKHLICTGHKKKNYPVEKPCSRYKVYRKILALQLENISYVRGEND